MWAKKRERERERELPVSFSAAGPPSHLPARSSCALEMAVPRVPKG
jgi:hypothetical protein